VNHERRGGTSGLAIAGFVLSIVGVIMISIVLCLVALNRVKTYNEKGRGLAIAGLVLSGLWLVGLPFLAFTLSHDEERDASGQVTAAQDVRADKLRVGDCVAEIKAGDNRDLKVLPCDQPNGGKVYAVFELPAGAWPGLTEVQAAAEKGCTDRIDAAGQQSAEPSAFWTLHTTAAAWRTGDRGITCLVAPG
jgi:hypothetical protein